MTLPSRLLRYAASAPADTSSLPPVAAPRCLWHACPDVRRGPLFCNSHGMHHSRRVQLGTMPPRADLEEMRPSQIAALTAPPPAAYAPPPAPVAPPPPAPPIVKPRVCLWPGCGRSAGTKALCSRCKARRRRLILRGILFDAPLTPSTAADLPALWQLHRQREHVLQRERGWPKAAPIVAKPDASLIRGACVAVGCDGPRYARGLCGRCYRRARHRGQLGEFQQIRGGMV